MVGGVDITPAYINCIKDNEILLSSRGVERRSLQSRTEACGRGDLLDTDAFGRLPRLTVRDLRLCRSFLSPRNDNIVTINHCRSNNKANIFSIAVAIVKIFNEVSDKKDKTWLR